MTETGRTRGRPMPNPGLAWDPGRTPFSTQFGDVYYSRAGGLAEARHVFLDGCGLPQAWREADTFTIVELGFGTALNFLAAWDLWRHTCKPGTRLHYIAVEGSPLTQHELSECLDNFPELRSLARGLLRVYPPPQPGFHRLYPVASDGGAADAVLTLLYGEAAAMLAQLEAGVDAWFLDGFAPDKNPAMWRAEIFTEMTRLSHDGARLATYDVAGAVRRGLDEAGFELTTTPGYGQKHAMLRGRFRGADRKSTLQPWFARPPQAPVQRGHAAIIGGGIAGTSAAKAMRRRGWSTTIIDRRDVLADEASGNPAGILMPRLTAAPNLDGRFYAGAWRFALETLEEISDAGLPLYRDRCGLLQLATDDAEAARQSAIAAEGPLPEPLIFQVGAKEASDIAGCALPYGALYFPQGGWLKPRDLCAALAGKSQRMLGVDVAALRHDDGLWQVIDSAGHIRTQADVVILANGLDAASWPVTAGLPLQARRGQITLAPPTPTSARLRSVLAYGGYMTPAHKGAHCIGATFDWSENISTTPQVDEDSHARNLADLDAALPGMMSGVNIPLLAGRAGIRCTTLDHLPLAGPVPDQNAYLHDFAELRHGHPWARYPQARYHPGLYVLTGLGSRGLVAGPLAAEIVAAHITGEPWPVEQDLVTALHPGRFLVRDLRRREA